MWANTVLAHGTALGLVIYTGVETKSVMNNSMPRNKMGLIDLELNNLTKQSFTSEIGFFLSLRVNLDVGKLYYSSLIQWDKEIPGTVVRSTTIPEELGRIGYLLTDKTGTLTCNEMVFKKLHIGIACYSVNNFEEVGEMFREGLKTKEDPPAEAVSRGVRIRYQTIQKVTDSVKAIALCHNVTPTYPESDISSNAEVDQDLSRSGVRDYQASSPDEVALVQWTEQVGLALIQRDLNRMTLRAPDGSFMHYSILQLFPFTSESKRMGIILKEEETSEIVFYLKGADMVMSSKVQYSEWLDEEIENMAREGLRTLVVARKVLTPEKYDEFAKRYHGAKLSTTERQARVDAVIEGLLEKDMELLCVTGVEDKLQENVKLTLELLNNAGVKVWMLTGDKLETAACIAKSSCLVSRKEELHFFPKVSNRTEAHLELNAFRRKSNCALVITGSSLEVCLQSYKSETLELACACPAVVVCRCSPTQKAQVVELIREHTRKRTAAIGDGGNDVSMIQAADAGIGIVGKEGRQASLAADFSLTQFSHIGRLLLVHGRYSYKRTAALSQFVIHRGLIISVMQAVFSAVFFFSSVALYQGILMVGYATLYTNFPVFSLVLDKDVTPSVALTYPELYKMLSKGRSLSLKTFFIWVLISVYQALLLFEAEFIHIVSISFTALIFTELAMVALTVCRWHYLMAVAQLLSLITYIVSMFFFTDIFDPNFLWSVEFLWKTIVLTVVSCVPLAMVKFIKGKISPPTYTKLSQQGDMDAKEDTRDMITPSDVEGEVTAENIPRTQNAPGTHWLLASFMVVNAALGAGLLNFPQAFDHAGGIKAAIIIQACHVSAIPIYSCIKKRSVSTFARSIGLALSLCILTYSLAGTFGYLTFGSGVASDILIMYDAKDPLVIIGITALAIKMYTTYPILLFCGREAILDLYYEVYPLASLSGNNQKHRILVATTWFLTSLLLAVLIPNITDIIDFLGSLAAVFIFILPGLFLLHMTLNGNDHPGTFSWWKIILASVSITLGTFLFGLVFVQAVEEDLSHRSEGIQLCI
ncbi:unnamed protein product [Darwinula stevensoni]|uniref:Phospholipid-transporting ATPase n=1 Tax=Darwinula stevensoni TaxID=69355 RepID=A0A7R8XDH5_9CRUS|nr:unnamed protein product [Darwinula stevensoni]CAG0893255.1 unnamed protein product [Darwinula stevensoni]